ncbi:RDD family protein [Luethyella okanaganae]|uniref:RDD family protein n=1 Tax=Luethyella okanaganae TaxID=69372 RepID=A0ABW1VDI2_9MICO
MSVTLDLDDDPIPGLLPDGRPDPEYAARLGLVAAEPLRRSLAFALDLVIWLALLLPAILGSIPLWSRLSPFVGSLGWLLDHPALPASLIAVLISQGLILVYGLVQLILHGKRGVTVGKATFGLRSVNVERFTAPGLWRVVLRVLVLQVAQWILPLAGPAVLFSSSFWDAEGRGRSWLDRVGHTWVLDVRRGLNPLDAKTLRHARRAFDSPSSGDRGALPSLATGASFSAAMFEPGARSSSGVVSAPSSGELADAGWSPPPLRSAAVAPSSSPQPAPVIVFDDGSRVRVEGLLLLGRSPQARPGEEGASALALSDESMRISKTHAVVGADEGGLWVADRGSTNGTYATTPGGARRRLVAEERTYLSGGTSIEIGGREFVVGTPTKGDG